MDLPRGLSARSGEPVPGAAVELEAIDNNYYGWFTRPRGTTDRDGSYVGVMSWCPVHQLLRNQRNEADCTRAPVRRSTDRCVRLELYLHRISVRVVPHGDQVRRNNRLSLHQETSCWPTRRSDLSVAVAPRINRIKR